MFASRRLVGGLWLAAACLVGACATVAALDSRPPMLVSPSATAAADPASMAPDGVSCVNVNTAPADELMKLPGIGPALAERIVGLRVSKGPYVRIESLRAVKGIGPSRLARIAGRICF